MSDVIETAKKKLKGHGNLKVRRSQCKNLSGATFRANYVICCSSNGTTTQVLESVCFGGLPGLAGPFHDSVVAAVCTDSKGYSPAFYRAFYHWLVNESWFSDVFVSKDADLIMKEGCIVVSLLKPELFVRGALILLRAPTEHNNIMQPWEMTGNMAFSVIASAFFEPGMGVVLKRRGCHNLIHPHKLTRKAAKFFMRGAILGEQAKRKSIREDFLLNNYAHCVQRENGYTVTLPMITDFVAIDPRGRSPLLLDLLLEKVDQRETVGWNGWPDSFKTRERGIRVLASLLGVEVK